MEIKAQFVKDLCVVGELGEKKQTVSRLETVLMSGQWPRGMTRRARRVFIFVLVDFPLRGTGKSKGDFAVCGRRLRALP